MLQAADKLSKSSRPDDAHQALQQSVCVPTVGTPLNSREMFIRSNEGKRQDYPSLTWLCCVSNLRASKEGSLQRRHVAADRSVAVAALVKVFALDFYPSLQLLLLFGDAVP